MSWSCAMLMRKDLCRNVAAVEMQALIREQVDMLVADGIWRGKVH